MLSEKRINKYVTYNNSLKPLNEGFFSWLGGLIKNLFKGMFKVKSYDEFVKKLNMMPRIILGLDNKNNNTKSNEDKKNNNTNSNEDKKELYEKPLYEKRSRFKNLDRKIYESRSRYTIIKEADEETENNSGENNSQLVKLIEEFKSFVDDGVKNQLEDLKKIVINNENIIALKNEPDAEEVFSDSELKGEYDKIVQYNESLLNKLKEISIIENEEEKKNAIIAIFDSEEIKQIKELKASLENLSNKFEELKKEKENLEKENDDLKDENQDLNIKIKKMSGAEYESEFKPIQNEEIDELVKSKKPSFKKTLAELLMKLRDQSSQLNKTFNEETLKKLDDVVKSGKTLALSDTQSMEITITDFLNLYSGNSMNLPKPEKESVMTIGDLKQYEKVSSQADNSKKFKTLYDSLKEVIKIYEESFISEWKFIREKEKEYEQEKARNSSWDGDGTVDYKTMQKIVENEIEVQGAMKSMVDQCTALIPNAIMGFFINSPIYQHTEETINKIINLLIANSKNIEDMKKNPELKVVSVFNDIMTNTINEEETENINKANDLFKEKVSQIVKKYPNKTTFSNNDINEFEKIIQNSNIKVNNKDVADTVMKKIQDIKSRLAFACLYYVYMNKPLEVIEDIDNQKIDLFNIENNQQQGNQNNNQQQDQQQNKQQNQQQNQQQGNQTPQATQNPQPQQPESVTTKRSRMKKIYDMYTWQK